MLFIDFSLFNILLIVVCAIYLLPKIIMGDETTETGEGDEEVTPSSPEIVFAPIIPLPDLVDLPTLEEEEEEIFKMRSKMYRMDNEADPPEWKEKGLGDLKILFHPKRKSHRIVMRREQTLKTCANHAITADMNLIPMTGSEKAFVWFTAADLGNAEEEARHETLAARFANKENADSFKAAFGAAVTKAVEIEANKANDDENKENETRNEAVAEEKKEMTEANEDKDKDVDKVASDLDKMTVKGEGKVEAASS